MTAIPMFIVAASAVFGFMLTIHGLGTLLGGLLYGVTESPIVFLLLVVVLLQSLDCSRTGSPCASYLRSGAVATCPTPSCSTRCISR